jgi:hypothetical protein
MARIMARHCFSTPSLLHTLVSQCACVDREEGGGEQGAGARGGGEGEYTR